MRHAQRRSFFSSGRRWHDQRESSSFFFRFVFRCTTFFIFSCSVSFPIQRAASFFVRFSFFFARRSLSCRSDFFSFFSFLVLNTLFLKLCGCAT
ncbi:hypothetical protein V8C40DRAFT_80461 [Trichoderma camerunense]